MVEPSLSLEDESVAHLLSNTIEVVEFTEKLGFEGNVSWLPRSDHPASVGSPGLDPFDSCGLWLPPDTGIEKLWWSCVPSASSSRHSVQDYMLQGARSTTPPLLQRTSFLNFKGDDSSVIVDTNATAAANLDTWSSDVPRWLCEACNRYFSASQKLEYHAKIERHRAFVCKQCNRGYSRRDTFVRHTASHKASELYYCEICQRNKETKAFKRKDHLRQHMKMHERNGQHIPSQSDNLNSSNQQSCAIQNNNTVFERMTNRWPGNATCDPLGDQLSIISDSADPSVGSHVLSSESCRRTESHLNREQQDVTSALDSILGKTESSVQIFGKPMDIRRGLARLALLEPRKLPPATKEELSALVFQLDNV